MAPFPLLFFLFLSPASLRCAAAHRRKEDFGSIYPKKGLHLFCFTNTLEDHPFEFLPDDCHIGLDCDIFDLLPEINVNYEK